MKRFAFLALAATAGLGLMSSGAAAQRLSPYMCQPLAADNRSQCCNASNWRDIILPSDIGLCSRSRGENRPETAAASAAQASPQPGSGEGEDPGTDEGGEPPVSVASGNPGNGKLVGHAGEKDMDDEAPSTPEGTRGASNRAE